MKEERNKTLLHQTELSINLSRSVTLTTITHSEYSNVKKYVFSKCNDKVKVTPPSGASNINLYDQSVAGGGGGQ